MSALPIPTASKIERLLIFRGVGVGGKRLTRSQNDEDEESQHQWADSEGVLLALHVFVGAAVEVEEAKGGSKSTASRAITLVFATQHARRHSRRGSPAKSDKAMAG